MTPKDSTLYHSTACPAQYSIFSDENIETAKTFKVEPTLQRDRRESRQKPPFLGKTDYDNPCTLLVPDRSRGNAARAPACLGGAFGLQSLENLQSNARIGRQFSLQEPRTSPLAGLNSERCLGTERKCGPILILYPLDMA